MGKGKPMDINQLSLREKICQTVVFYTWGNDHLLNRYDQDLSKLLADYPFGGVFFGAEVIKSPETGVNDITTTAERWQKNSRIPMAICGDLEAGAGAAVNGLTLFPSLMALGATHSSQLAFDYGRDTAIEGLSVGFNWALSPVADINLNRLNPAANVRAIGDSAELVRQQVVEYVKGMQSLGMAATAKHFPGDGTDARDQHMYTTRNGLSREAWMNTFGAVYRSLIEEANVWSIMTGHISLPAWQKQDFRRGRPLPATLSYELSTKLLKDELGFKGVIVSDALVMGGFIKWHDNDPVQAEIECFNAGTDMMLWPSPGYVSAMEKAVQTGVVKEERLNDAVVRIWRMKQEMGLFKNPYFWRRSMEDSDRVHVAQTATRVAEQSLTLVRDNVSQLPFSSGAVKTVLLSILCRDDVQAEAVAKLAGELEKRGISVLVERNPDYAKTRELAPKVDKILVVACVWPQKPMGPLGFCAETWSLWGTLDAGQDKTVVIGAGSPYTVVDDFEQAETCINTYSCNLVTWVALVKALFGEIPFCGRSPVNMTPPTYRF